MKEKFQAISYKTLINITAQTVMARTHYFSLQRKV